MTSPRSAARALIERALRAEHGDDLDRALELYADAAIQAMHDPEIVAEALVRQAAVYRRRSEWDISAEYARRAGTIAEDAGLPVLAAEALIAEGNALMCRGQLAQAIQVYERLLRVAPDRRRRGIALQNLGSVHAQQGDHRSAVRCFRESRAIFRSDGYRRGEAIAENNLGRLALDDGLLDEAEEWLADALLSALAVEDAELVALVQVNQAQLCVLRGDPDGAAAGVHPALGHFAAAQNRWRQIECRRVLGDIDALRGDADAARAQYAAAVQLARDIDATEELALSEARLAALDAAPPTKLDSSG